MHLGPPIVHGEMGRAMSSRWPKLVSIGVAAALGLSYVAVSAPSAMADGPGATVASGRGWSVDRDAGGYRVKLALGDRLPMVSDAPTLRVNGKDIGPAVESADGRSLTVHTNDPSVADATSVTKGWSSGDQTKTTENGTAPRTRATPGQQTFEKSLKSLADAQTRRLATEPSAHGAYKVTEAEYDFGDQATALRDIGGIRGEMTGKMYLSSAKGARPTIVLMHGRHSSCSQGTPNPDRWPCGKGQVNVRSYLGYQGTARALASDGYNVVSIAVNAVNSNDNQLAADYGASARGQMMLQTLDMLRKAGSGRPVTYHDTHTGRTLNLDDALTRATTRSDQPATRSGITARSLIGRFDLGRVGIMGHSRGGEGVMAAATQNQGLPHPFGIRAVLPLAPVDFGRMTLPDTPMATMLPYCDGDVSNQQGQHMFDDSRNAFNDNVQRSAVWVMGANHNFFNSVWTPGKYPYATSDDWDSRDTTSSCSTNDPTRLTADQQYQIGVSFMTGYFRYIIGGEKQFAPMFDGSAKPSTPSTRFSDIRVMAAQPHNRTTMIDDFTSDSPRRRTTGAARAGVCVNATGVTLGQSLPLCSTRRTSSTGFPHWAQMRFGANVPAFPVTRVTWSRPGDSVHLAVPRASRDVSGTSRLTLRTMPDESVAEGTDFVLSVVDGQGHRWSRPASRINPLAVGRLPGGSNPTLNKLVMQQLSVPTNQISGVNLADVREIGITAARGADDRDAGGVYLSDLAFETAAAGTTRIAQHTTINVGSTSVDEGDAPGSVAVPVWLNRPSPVPVTGYVSSTGSLDQRAGIGMQKVTFAPGQMCRAVEMPLQGDRQAGATATSLSVLSVTNTQHAVMGSQAFGWLSVREDDGVVGGEPAPQVGSQGDACAEAARARTPGVLALSRLIVRPGQSLTATGGRFRAGESVLFRLADGELGRAVADRHGVARLTGAIPESAAAGRSTVTAVGAGSGVVDRGAVTVAGGRRP